MLNGKLNRNPITRIAFIASAVLLWTVSAHPAAQQSEPVFEVASIKENKSGTDRVYMNVLPGGRLVATNISLETLVAGAYGSDIPLPPNRVVLPAAWVGSGAPRFDIEAKAVRDFRPGELLAAVRHRLRTDSSSPFTTKCVSSPATCW